MSSFCIVCISKNTKAVLSRNKTKNAHNISVVVEEDADKINRKKNKTKSRQKPNPRAESLKRGIY